MTAVGFLNLILIARTCGESEQTNCGYSGRELFSRLIWGT